MSQSNNQSELFSSPEIQRIDLEDAELVEHKKAFSYTESRTYFTNLLDHTNWQTASIRIGGRVIPIPRLQCWVADADCRYSYSGISMVPENWSEQLLEIRSRVEALAEQSFNAVLMNLYRNGDDSVSWHADDEPELGSDPVVASVSFGAARPFELKHRNNDTRFRLTLTDGSLLVMGKGLQNNWLHQIPKVRSLQEPRINLTFRRIVSRES